MNKKIISVIAIATLISLSFISGTYARYTTNIVDKTDSARVAKWDINITRDIDLFSDSYLNNTNNQIVKSINNDAIVAPGTSGKYTFTISGEPETNFTLGINVLEAVDTVGRITYDLDGIFQTTDINLLKFYLENLLGKDEVYPANKPLAINKHTISWKWELDEDDAADTMLGNSAITDKSNSNYNSQPMVKLKVKVTATQSSEAANVNLD